MSITRMASAIWLMAAVSHGRETVQQITTVMRYGSNDRLTVGAISVTWKDASPARRFTPPPSGAQYRSNNKQND